MRDDGRCLREETDCFFSRKTHHVNGVRQLTELYLDLIVVDLGAFSFFFIGILGERGRSTVVFVDRLRFCAVITSL